jgi:hypothetical protein
MTIKSVAAQSCFRVRSNDSLLDPAAPKQIKMKNAVPRIATERKAIKPVRVSADIWSFPTNEQLESLQQ